MIETEATARKAEDGETREQPCLKWEAPLRLVTLSNAKGHWRTRHERAKTQRNYAAKMTNASRQCGARFPNPPYRITITRIGKRNLDSDNLQGSAKHIRDGIADALQISDGDESAATWIVLQEKGDYAVRVRIEGQPDVD